MSDIRCACAFAATLAATACGPISVSDLRFESVRSPSETELEAARNLLAPRERADEPLGATALVSTSEDLRARLRSSAGVYVEAERCGGGAGRGTGERANAVGALGLFDERGRLDRTASHAPTHSPGRRTYGVFLWRRTATGTVRDSRTGRALTSWADADLARDREDICVRITAVFFLGSPWTSNTVVIPHAAIRAALGASAE